MQRDLWQRSLRKPPSLGTPPSVTGSVEVMGTHGGLASLDDRSRPLLRRRDVSRQVRTGRETEDRARIAARYALARTLAPLGRKATPSMRHATCTNAFFILLGIGSSERTTIIAVDDTRCTYAGVETSLGLSPSLFFIAPLRARSPSVVHLSYPQMFR